MNGKEEKTNFLDFILAAQKNENLTQGFMAAKTAKALKNFFKKNKFEDITPTDCDKILKTREQAKGLMIDHKGRFGGCPPGTFY